MLIFKQSKTIEQLMKECENSYNVFIEHINMAYHRDYYDFKIQYKEDCYYLMKEIVMSEEEKLKRKLIFHFQNQLEFINKNPFSANKEKLEKFIQDNYPYIEKVEQIKGSCFYAHQQRKKF